MICRKYWSMTAQIINWCSTFSTRYIHSAHTSGRYQYDRPEASTDKGVRARCSILWKDKVLEHSWYPEITKYTYHGKLLTHMNVNYLDWDEAEHNDEMHFFYDAQSRLAKVSFNREMYTYVHSLQGDIVGILDSEGALVVEYKYDAWGRLLATTVASSANEAEKSMWEALAKLNPFRYRGYVYDEESGLYYLRSRYYNPKWGRVISSDTLLGVVGTLGSHNPFTYCNNSPSVYTDPDGNYAKEWYDESCVVGTISVVATSVAIRNRKSRSSSSASLSLSDAKVDVSFRDVTLIAVAALITAGQTKAKSNASTKVIEQSEDQDSPTYIYRYGSSTYYNLTPRADDLYLSFSLKPPTNGKAFRTTLEAINATEVLVAFNDHDYHISVAPVKYETMEDWRASKSTANDDPHPYTLILYSLAQ